MISNKTENIGNLCLNEPDKVYDKFSIDLIKELILAYSELTSSIVLLLSVIDNYIESYGGDCQLSDISRIYDKYKQISILYQECENSPVKNFSDVRIKLNSSDKDIIFEVITVIGKMYDIYNKYHIFYSKE